MSLLLCRPSRTATLLAFALWCGVVGTRTAHAQPAISAASPPTESTPPVEAAAAPRTDVLGDPLPPATLLRLGTIRFRHPASLAEMALTPDGQTVLTIGSDLLIAWDVTTGRERWRAATSDALIPRGQSACYGQRLLACSDDSRFCYSPRRDGDLVKWNLETGAFEVVPVERRQTVPAIAGNNEGTSAVDVTRDGRLLVIGNARGVAVCDGDGRLKYEVLNLLEQPAEFDNSDRLTFGGPSSDVRFSHNGRVLAIVLSSAPKVVRLLDAATGDELRRITLTDRLVRLDFSPDDAHLVATERDSAVREYDVATGRELWSHGIPPMPNAESYTCGVAYSPSEKLVAVCAPMGSDYGIRLLDSGTGAELAKLEGHTWKPWHVAFSPDGDTLYSAGWDGPIRRWDVKPRRQLPLPQGVRAGGAITASPDGHWLSYSDDAGTVRLVDAVDGREVRTFRLEGCSYSQLAFTPDSRSLAGGGFTRDDIHMALWNVDDGALRQRWDWPKGKDPHSDVEALEIHPDGRWLAAASFRQNKAYLLDASTGEVTAEMSHRNVYGLSFSPDGAHLATAGWDQFLRQWDVPSGQIVSERKVTELPVAHQDLRMYGVVYAPAGDLAAAAHMDGNVSVWDRDFNQRNSFSIGQRFLFGSLAFSPDGSLLVSGDSAGRVAVWDARTGECVWDRGKHAGYVYVVGFAAQGDRVYSSGQDGVCYVWDLRPDDESDQKTFDELWADLSWDTKSAFDAGWRMLDRPDQTVAFLRKKLGPIEELVEMHVLTADVTREEAVRRAELARLMVNKNASIEFDIVVRRAMNVLVRLHTPEAKALLQQLVDRRPNSEVATLAREALLRFQ